MAGDYHIYLHGIEGRGENKTTPFSQKQTSSSAFSTSQSGSFQAQNETTEQATNTGVAVLSKVAPWVAAFVAVAKITDHILSTGFAHQEEYTGNYVNNVNYNNFKTEIHNVFHPIQAFLKVKHQEAQFRKQNREIAQQNRLIGNSVLKDFNIGV